MANGNRITRHDGDAFSDRDDDEEVTIADLRQFGERVTTSIVDTIRHDLDQRDRIAARRERVNDALTPAAPAADQSDPAATARRLGVSPEAFERAVAAARAQEQAAELRPYIADYIREELPSALDELLEDDDDAAPRGKRNGQARKPATRTATAKPNGNGPNGDRRPGPDSEPVETHWAERKLWG